MRRLDLEVDLAELTHRLVTHQQLRQSLTNRQIAYRVAVGALHPVVRGVYSLDEPRDDFLTRAIALCLRSPSGFLSGPAAVHYWGLRRGVPELYEFTVPYGRTPSGLEHVQYRYCSSIDPRDVFNAPDGLRVSSAARAVFESAGRLDEFGLRSLVQDGLKKGTFSAQDLTDVGSRLARQGRRGTRLFRRVNALLVDEPPVHSEEELLLLDALRAAGLTDATPQFPVRLPNGFVVHADVGVPRSLVDVEVDGPTHDDPVARHRDRARDVQMAVVGWQTLRYGADEIRRSLRVVTAGVLHVCRQRASS